MEGTSRKGALEGQSKGAYAGLFKSRRLGREEQGKAPTQ
jgi:hypothetical protein